MKKILLLVGLLLAAAVPAGAQTQYVFMYNNNYIFGQSTSVSTDFIPNNCVYTGTSGGTFQNGNGYYIVYANQSVSFSTSSGSTLTISNNYLYYNNSYYLRYSASANSNQGGWQFRNNFNAQATAYAVTTGAVINSFSVSGDDAITTTGTNSSYAHTNATYYDSYSFNSLTYYSTDPSVAASTTAPTSGLPTLTDGYTWSLTASSYATVNSTTGAITVSSLPPTDQVLTLTCSVTRNGVTRTATKTVTIEAPKVDPTSLSITSSNPMTVYVGNTGTISYSLTPSPCYDNVSFSSASTATASVGANGVVTGVATGTTTVTVTARKIDNSTTSDLTKTVDVMVRDVVATPTVSYAPIDDGTTATATIACATAGVTIYYTTDGSEPTTASDEYTGSFTVSDGDVVRAIAVKSSGSTAYWDNSVPASSTYSKCSTAAPTISYIQSGTAATVTIAAEAGATVYYTTDGTDPTSGSTHAEAPVTINGVAGGSTVKAYAQNGLCQASSIVSKEIIVSGVNGGTVTLYDLEDHTWSYYSNAECPIHSLGPADVKITYYGNGENTVSTTNGTAPADDSWNAKATGVKVNRGGEDENTFVYYKTLERYNGTTTDSYEYGNTAIYGYTTIPNPFQVRPTYGTGDTRWRGFYKWRIKTISNGHIYTAANKTGEKTAYTSGNYNESNMLDAEETYYFVPDDEYDMEVELEAMWARAYVVTSNTTTGLYNSVSYERNFVYLSSNTTLRNAALNYPVTYTTVDPATGEGTKRTITIRDGFTCGANTKFENVIFAQYNNNNQVITSNGHDLVIGRGCTGTINRVRGLAEDSDNDVSYILRVESGTFDNFDMLNNVGGTYGGVVALKAIIGNDYDRATANNTLLTLAENGIVYGKSNNAGNASVSFTSASNRNSKVFDWYVKSGTIQGSKLGDASADNALYLGHPSSNNTAQYTGKRYLTVEGGNLANIAGGVNNYATNHENFAVNDGDPTIYIRIKGGTVRGSVYGAGAYGGSSGNVKYVFTGGTINGWVAGGCNGTQNTGGELYGLTSIYIGGKTNVVQSATDPRIGGTSSYGTNGAYGGNIFGAGCGIQPAAYNASNPGASLNNLTVGKVYGSTVVIADESVVGRDVYGGGNFGLVDDGTQSGWTNNPSKTANLYILGGTVKGNVYGGSNNQNGQIVDITMTGGTIEGGLYGGSNSWGTINNDVTMQINGGQVGTTTTPANIHGGGYGSATIVSGNVDITLGTTTSATGVTVYGDVYGGSALGSVNGTSANTTYHTNVTLNAGTINGSLYGGALGSNSVAANVYAPVKVKVYGGSVKKTSVDGSGGVYGANNINGAPQRSVTVDIYGTDPAPATDEYALYAVYGGGNQADYTYGNGYPTVTVHNCDNSIEYVYGGGNAAAVDATDVTIWGGNKIGNVFGGGNGTVQAANVTGNAATKIYGGTIGSVFGGSNSQGTIGGTISVTVQKQNGDTDPDGSSTACDMHIGEVYGGGNMAASQAGSIAIGCTGNQGEGIGDVYGGANQANITGNIALVITGGSIERVFGGNNVSGSISGTIQVDVNWNTTSPCSYNYLGEVYGGGNQAAYSGTPDVNIINGTVERNVFGGGNNITTSGYGVAGGDVEMTGGTVKGNLFGGCNVKGTVTGTTTVKMSAGTVGVSGVATDGCVFGGGLGSGTNVTGKATVEISGTATVVNNVFGGGSQGTVGSTQVTIKE